MTITTGAVAVTVAAVAAAVAAVEAVAIKSLVQGGTCSGKDSIGQSHLCVENDVPSRCGWEPVRHARAHHAML